VAADGHCTEASMQCTAVTYRAGLLVGRSWWGCPLMLWSNVVIHMSGRFDTLYQHCCNVQHART
jgi:hypothetical protein